jgi:hypothetical protein
LEALPSIYRVVGEVGPGWGSAGVDDAAMPDGAQQREDRARRRRHSEPHRHPARDLYERGLVIEERAGEYEDGDRADQDAGTQLVCLAKQLVQQAETASDDQEREW